MTESVAQHNCYKREKIRRYLLLKERCKRKSKRSNSKRGTESDREREHGAERRDIETAGDIPIRGEKRQCLTLLSNY